MTLQYWLDTYGYLAIIIGSFLEGETILVLGGIAAKLGYLELPWVIICAFSGSFFGDQLYFFIGRYRGKAFLAKRPAWQGRADKIHRILEVHRIPVILGFRFLYGLRVITPFVIGMSRIPIAQFVILNALGTALWAIGIGVLGYVVGHGLDLILGNLRHYELEVFALFLLGGGLIWIIHSIHLKRRRNSKQRKK